MPDTSTDEIRAQHARLDALAAEHAADRPADATDPAAWARRATDRVQLELAAVQHLHELRVAAGNKKAEAAPPVKMPEACATCGLDPAGRSAVAAPEGLRCLGCTGREEVERAVLRSARGWPDDQRAARLDALDDATLSNLSSIVGGARALRYSRLSDEVRRANQRRGRLRQAEHAARAKARKADAQPAQHGHGGHDAA